MTIYQGGKTNYGETIGILMLDTTFPRMPGDIGNATSFNFPVRYQTVIGASPTRVVKEADPALLQPFIDGALALQKAGVRAVTTSCGFLAMFQKEVSQALDIPFFSSSLIQAKIAKQIIGPDKIVGIITARAASLGDRHFKAVGIDDVPKVVFGMEDTKEFYATFVEGKESFDADKAEIEMVDKAKALIAANPNVGAIVFECTNMCPFAAAVQEAVKLPVFDVSTLINYIHSVVCRKRFIGEN